MPDGVVSEAGRWFESQVGNIDCGPDCDLGETYPFEFGETLPCIFAQQLISDVKSTNISPRANMMLAGLKANSGSFPSNEAYGRCVNSRRVLQAYSVYLLRVNECGIVEITNEMLKLAIYGCGLS